MRDNQPMSAPAGRKQRHWHGVHDQWPPLPLETALPGMILTPKKQNYTITLAKARLIISLILSLGLGRKVDINLCVSFMITLDVYLGVDLNLKHNDAKY